METQRKFTQKVAMPIKSRIQFAEIAQGVAPMGYAFQQAPTGGYPWLIITDDIEDCPTLAYIHTNTTTLHLYQVIETWSPEFFLAMAAMSATDEFYPGEWVVINDRSIDEILIVHQSENSYLCVKRIEEKDEPGYFTVPKENFRKATVEEIKTHFLKGSFPDTPLVEFDPDNIDPKSIPKKSHHIDGMEMFFSQPMAENQIRDLMGLIEKYNQPQTKENQLPRFGAHIQVWNRDDKKLTDAFFIGMDNMGLVVTCYQNPTMLSQNYGDFRVKKYDHYIKFGDPVYIPKSEAFSELAESRGVHPDQIKIDFEK